MSSVEAEKTIQKHYSVMLFAGNKKVSIPLVDTGQRIEKKSKSGKYRNLILRVFQVINKII
jgi:hypothetical protein